MASAFGTACGGLRAGRMAVPVVGGHTGATILPLLSQVRLGGHFREHNLQQDVDRAEAEYSVLWRPLFGLRLWPAFAGASLPCCCCARCVSQRASWLAWLTASVGQWYG